MEHKTKEYIMTSQNKEKFHEDPMKTQSKTSTLFKAREKLISILQLIGASFSGPITAHGEGNLVKTRICLDSLYVKV